MTSSSLVTVGIFFKSLLRLLLHDAGSEVAMSMHFTGGFRW